MLKKTISQTLDSVAEPEPIFFDWSRLARLKVKEKQLLLKTISQKYFTELPINGFQNFFDT